MRRRFPISLDTSAQHINRSSQINSARKESKSEHEIIERIHGGDELADRAY